MKKNRIYVKLGLTLLCVVLASVAFTVVLSNLRGFFAIIESFIGILSPILFGILFAYLMNPIMQFVENGLMYLLRRVSGAKQLDCARLRTRKRWCHILGVICALAVLLLVFYLAISLVVPTLVENISTIANPDKIISYYGKITTWLHQLLSDNPDFEAWVMDRFAGIYDSVEQWLSEINLPKALVSLTTQVYGVVKGTLNFLIGLVIAVYMLLSKEKFLAQSKKVMVALFSEQRCNRLLEIGRRTNRIFSGFVLGKIIDSAIIGIICYIVMAILKLPYPMLISVIVGVTNIIPFFGPLIGAIPSAFLILLIDPLQCFIFIIFIVCLQQFDGNFLGPRILGDSVGLSSFWILISITLFSGIFGFAGMVLGVPVFAVLYMLLRDLVQRKLTEKGRPLQTEVYEKIYSTDDLTLAQKRAEVEAEQAAFAEDETEAYEMSPEIEDLDETALEHYLEQLDEE